MPEKAAPRTTADLKSIPVTTIKGVGPKIADRLGKLNIHSVQDVLFHFPFRYQDRTKVVSIGSLQTGQEAVVLAEIELTEVVFRGKRNLVCRITDGTGFLSLRFFHFSSLQQNRLQRGNKIYAYGEVRAGRSGLEMIHPEYEVMPPEADRVVDEQLTPVYSTTEGVHQISMRKIVQDALDRYSRQVTDWLPDNVLLENNYPSLREAVEGLHRPAANVDTEKLLSGFHPFQQRLAFEELLAHQLSLRLARQKMRKDKSIALKPDGRYYLGLLAGLPYQLTGAQKRVIDQVCDDVSRDIPMQRLCQGDVGSGKTVIAAAAAAVAVDSGCQVAIMVPTELLADQHLGNFLNWFDPLGVRVIGLTGRHTGKQRNSILGEIEGGQASVVVGTHALFQKDVTFRNLSLIVVDEQHRFGVAQRLALKEKAGQDGLHPHQLIMTATPIPRTLAQTLYADLDVSVIDELPPGRQPVQTVVVPENRRAEVVERVDQACRQGRQVYWVCPLIEESENVDWQAATEVESGLKEALSNHKVGLVHGRMKPAEKEEVMRSFKMSDLDLLVATTVIEVGVDVPNASLMVIENAERLGLSQLHQLRGRVGRGTEESACVLLYHSPLSRVARERLEAMRTTNDGFIIAQKDMELRGPGELLGLRQAGMPEFQVADLWRDQKLLPSIQETAEMLESEYPDRIQPLIDRWFGQADRYGNV